MNVPDVLTLYDYNYWATRRLLTAGAQVSPAQFAAPTGHSFGSLRGTLVHILDCECAWRMRCQQRSLAGFNELAEEDFPTLEVVVQSWNEEESVMRNYLGGLTDAGLAGSVRYTTPDGDERERVLWHCLLHVVNHGTHHRSQAAAILKGYGHPAGALDFTAFLNQQQ